MRNFLLISFLSLYIASCSSRAATDRYLELVEDCWEFVDTGDFPTRGLYWVPNTDVPTYENRKVGLRIAHTAYNADQALCAIANKGAIWEPKDRDVFLPVLITGVSEMIALRSDVPADDITSLRVSKGEFTGHLLLKPSSGSAGVFATVIEYPETGIVGTTIGKGPFPE